MGIRRSLIVILLLLPLTITAAPQNLVFSWDLYPDNTATLSVECKTGTDVNYTLQYENVTAFIVSRDITFEAAQGQLVQCRNWAVNATSVSPRSEVATYRVPFTSLPAPQNPALVAR